MRLRTQLFLGISFLAIALMVAQTILQRHQLQALEVELTRVVEGVGTTLFSPENRLRIKGVWADEENDISDALKQAGIDDETFKKVQLLLEGERAGGLTWHSSDNQTRVEVKAIQDEIHEDGIAIKTHEIQKIILKKSPSGSGEQTVEIERDESDISVEIIAVNNEKDAVFKHRTMVIKGPDGEATLQLPESRAGEITEDTLYKSLLASGGLLFLGLLAAAFFADRVTLPLRALAAGAEALGSGDFTTQVETNATGEIGELQRAFNQMSERLKSLEEEKKQWQARAHLAELGDVARGLGHSLRNPLNTLGLLVEEMAVDADNEAELVQTAREQITRIDRWLRGFLAVGAGHAATPDIQDLRDILEEVALESSGALSLDLGDEPVMTRLVRPALKAAILNLVVNALQVSEEGSPVEVHLNCSKENAEITIMDRGPGIPSAIRERLFSPHVTTRTEGSGMGLFLARQLIEGGHGGKLSLRDRPGGGTTALIILPIKGIDT